MNGTLEPVFSIFRPFRGLESGTGLENCMLALVEIILSEYFVWSNGTERIDSRQNETVIVLQNP